MLNVTRRVRVSTGLMCNIRCPFCYYNEELNQQQYPRAEVQRMLRLAHDLGIREIDFSGGEPTVRKDFVDLVAFARGLGFERICVITNGTRIHDRGYLERLAAAGLNEVLLSVQAASPGTSLALSGRAATFERVEAALARIDALGIRLRTNTVLTRTNLGELGAIVERILPYRPQAVNFICFNDWVNAAPVTREMAVRFSEVTAPLDRAIQRLEAGQIPRITVRYMPYCLLPGRGRHLCGLQQKLYDPDEWLDPVKRALTDIDRPERFRAYLEGLERTWRGDRDALIEKMEVQGIDWASLDAPDAFRSLTRDNLVPLHLVDNHQRRLGYVKGRQCRECRYDALCDGLHAGYARALGTAELRPQGGEPLSDPLALCRSYLTASDPDPLEDAAGEAVEG